MNLLLVASIIFALCQVHGRGHPRKKHPQKESTTSRNEPTTKGYPPLCSKLICEKIKDPFRDFSDLPLLPDPINPYVRYAYVNNTSVVGPYENCTSVPTNSYESVAVGLTKDNQIVHLFRVSMLHTCISTGLQNCNLYTGYGKGYFKGKCFYFTENIITINQSGVVIGDDLGSNWDDNDDIICLNC